MSANFDSARPPVFRGSFTECLEHLGRCYQTHFPKLKKGREQALQPIADFCRVSAGTVKDWLEGREPIGEPRIAMMCMLDLIGYRVIDLEKLQEKRGLAELIGYGIIMMKEASDYIGYVNSQDISAVLQQKQGMSNKREQRMIALCGKYRNELTRAKTNASLTFAVGFPLTTSVSQHEVAAVIYVMDGLQALLDSPTAGAMFRQHLQNPPPADGHTVIKLATTLADLASCLSAKNGGDDGQH